jgi:ribosomal protein L7/L12
MYDPEKTYDKAVKAHLRVNALALALRGVFIESDTDAKALEMLMLECQESADELMVASAAPWFEFVTVELTSIGDKKIEVIKLVRALTGLGLKESKDLVERAPTPLKELVAMSDANEIKRALEAAGATVTLLEPHDE